LEQKVHYRVHKMPPPVPILNHTNATQTPVSYFFDTSFNSIPQSKPMPSKWSLFSVFTTVIICFFCVWIYNLLPVPCVLHSHLFISHPNNIWWAVRIIKFLMLHFSPQRPVSSNLNLFYSHRARDRVSHTHFFEAQIIYSATFSPKSSSFILPSEWENTIYSDTNI
jgi:hypothetical protein